MSKPRESAWQVHDGRGAAALRCALARLGAAELWRCAAVCRAWRAVALDDALWRRALLPRATPRLARAFAAAAADDSAAGRRSWRREYALSALRWRRRARLPAPTSAPLLHAALAPRGPGDRGAWDARLALLAEDASISIWEPDAGGRWRETWAGDAPRGWRRAERASWAAGAARLLLAGPLALCDRWELAVLQPSGVDAEWRVTCRAEGGAGGASCWAGDAAFLTLRPCLLAPGLAVTTAWLTACSQEASSEYAGVMTPLLRIFNEAAAHIPLALVAEMPAAPVDVAPADELPASDDAGAGACGPLPEYYAAIDAVRSARGAADRLVVAALGAAGGKRGAAQALGAWRVRAAALAPPPLLAGAGLAERVRRRRAARAAPPAPDPPPPGEAAVRALCDAPDDTCVLGDPVLGLVLHPRGACVWASTARGAWCVTLPTLRRVLRVPLGAAPAAAPPHYVVPDVDDDFFVTPAGGGAGRVQVFAARSGRAGAALAHAGAALAALLPPTPRAARRSLLVLTPDAVHVWDGSDPTYDE